MQRSVADNAIRQGRLPTPVYGASGSPEHALPNSTHYPLLHSASSTQCGTVKQPQARFTSAVKLQYKSTFLSQTFQDFTASSELCTDLAVFCLYIDFLNIQRQVKRSREA